MVRSAAAAAARAHTRRISAFAAAKVPAGSSPARSQADAASASANRKQRVVMTHRLPAASRLGGTTARTAARACAALEKPSCAVRSRTTVVHPGGHHRATLPGR